jgi:PBP1b-binding outer membrane lipoprotein LpoB
VDVSTGQKKEPAPGQAEGVWQSAEGNVDDSKVVQLLNALSNLKCRAYLYDQKKSDLKSQVYTVKVKTMEDHSLSLFAKNEKDKNDHPAVSSQNDSPFLLSDQQAKQIMVPLDQIVKP